MSIRALFFAAVLFGTFGVVNTSHAQLPQMTRSQADPSEKLFRLVAPDGTVVAADGQTRRFYIQSSGGATAEITFDQALAHAEPNATRRAQLEAKFEGALANSSLENYMYTHKLEPCVPPPGQEFCQIEQDALPTHEKLGVWNRSEDDEEDPETTDLEGITVTARRPFIMIGGDGSGWGYWPGGGTYRNPYTPGSNEALNYQQCFAADFKAWQQGQQGACQTASFGAAATVGLGLSAAGSCAAAAVRGSAASLACAGSVIGLLVSMGSAIYYQNQCMAQYPGPEHC